MSKEEPGRLFNKMAKFVRNPLKDWSEIDKQPEADAASPDNGYSREMLREMIERRQRNDFVRRREFDQLRKLRQREAAGQSGDPGQGSGFSLQGSTNGKSHGRAVTLRKIDEIEEQMSRQWWKNREPGAEPADLAHGADPQVDAEVLADKQRRAYADTTPGVMPGSMPGGAGGPPSSLTAGVASELGDSRSPSLLSSVEEGLEEAAVRFAQGDDAGAEAILLQVVAADSAVADDPEAWLTLLDFYRATGDAEKFVAASTRYAQRMHRQGPEWVSLRALAHGARAHAAALRPDPASVITAHWRSEPHLIREGLIALTRALASAGAVWTLDWRALTSISPDCAAPMRVLFSHWAGSQVEIRFFGAARLAEVLERATPTAERATDEMWWRLRMATLRLSDEVDAFELVALQYCITYEVSPPPWEDPVCRYRSLDPAPVPASFPGMQESAPRGTDFGALVGDLSGETASGSASVWQRLDAEVAEIESPVVSCAALVRMDFTAAGELMTWAAAQEARGRKVHFKDLHRVMGIFFRLVGIDRHAQVSVRTR